MSVFWLQSRCRGRFFNPIYGQAVTDRDLPNKLLPAPMFPKKQGGLMAPRKHTG